MADSAVVGVLRAMLTAENASFDTGMRKSEQVALKTGKGISGLGKEVAKLTPQAEKMAKSLGGDKLLYTANSLTQAITKIGGAEKLTAAERARSNRTLSDAIAKYTALGQQAPAAMIATERATRRAEGPLVSLSSKMRSIGPLLAGFAGGIAAGLVTQAIPALIQFTREAFNAAGQIVDLSKKTGLSTDTIQRMQFVAEQTGGSLEQFTQAAFMLGVRLAGGSGSVKKAVEDLGLSFQAIQRMRPDQQFETIVAALSRMANEQERNRIGAMLFGKQFSSIAAGVAQDYKLIADSAKLSGEAQLKALDAASDRWDAFVRNAKTGMTSFLGQQVLLMDAMQQVEAEFKKQGKRPDGPTMFAEAQRRVDRGLMTGRKTDIKLTEEAVKAERSYGQQLAAVRAELARLTPAQRAEIDAAMQLGVNTDELENKYGLTEGALRILNSQTKDYEKNLKSSASAAEKAAAEADKLAASYRDVMNFIGEREIEDAANALKQLETEERSLRQAMNQIGEQEIADHAAALKEKEAAEREWRDVQNELGVRMMEAEFERMEEQRHRAERISNAIKQRIGDISQAAFGGLGTLLFGFGNDNRQLEIAADEAEQDYLRIKRSGKATAEELTLAFRRFHEAEERANHGFAERFKDVWQGIKTTLQRILNEILQFFVESFLKGLIKGMAGAKLGQRLGNAFGGGGGGGSGGGFGGGDVAMWAGKKILGKIGIGGGASVAGSAATAGLPSSVAASTLPGVGAAPGAAGGGAGAGGGSFLTNPAFWTNPWTIGIGAGIVLGWAIWKKGLFRGGWEVVEGNKRRDKFLKQFGDPSIKGVGGADHNLAKKLTEFTGIAGGGPLLTQLHSGKKKQFESAEDSIIALFARNGVKNLKKFMFGGFVPPGVVMPSILHGGGRGELAAPMDKLAEMIAERQGGGRMQVQITNHISTIDAKGVRDFVESPAFTRSVARVFDHNIGYLNTSVGRAMA